LRTGPLRLVLVVGITLYVAMRLTGWLQRESGVREDRDATASVAGRIVDDQGRPLGGAHVFITDDDARLPFTATSEADGTFRIEKLPKGAYQLGAAKEGHLGAYFAQALPHWGVTSVSVDAGAAVTGLEVRLPRTAAVEGVVLSETGAPLADHEIRMRAVGRASGQAIVSGAFGVARSDASGRFTIDHLDAGEYAIVVRPRTPPQTVLFYPGALKLSGARTITVERGEHRRGLELRVPQARTTTIEGVVTYAGGRPPSRLEVQIFDADATLPLGEDRSVETDADGRFVIPRVPAGRFTLVTQTTLRPQPEAGARDVTQTTRLSASATVKIDGTSAPQITLSLGPGVPVSGRLLQPHRAATTPVDDDDPITVRLSGADAESRARLGFGGPEARVAADGSFTLLFVPRGRFHFIVSDRLVATIALGGRDVTPAPIDVGDAEVRDVVLAVSRRTGEIDGTLRGESGAARGSGAVILFPADRRWWTDAGRVRMTRPDSSGRFRFEHVAAGDHLLAAVADAPFGAWDERSFLERLEPRATAVKLEENGRKTLELSSLQTFNKTDGR
jgi:hypothetical protein